MGFDKKKYWERRNEGRATMGKLGMAMVEIGGKRGQGDKLNLTRIAKWTEEDHKAGKCGKEQIGKERTSGVTMHMTKSGLKAITRRMKRAKDRARSYFPTRKVLDREETEKQKKPIFKTVEDLEGRLLTRKGARHVQNDEKNPKTKLPTKDPSLTNHQRLEQKRKPEEKRVTRRAVR